MSLGSIGPNQLRKPHLQAAHNQTLADRPEYLTDTESPHKVTVLLRLGVEPFDHKASYFRRLVMPPTSPKSRPLVLGVVAEVALDALALDQ